MKTRFLPALYLIAGLGLLAGLGCHHDEGPPPPLPVEQMSAEFSKAFQNAKPEVKELADKVLKAVESKAYPAAYQATQELTMAPGATPAQQALAARALMTVTGLLQTAQAQGDESAAAALKVIQSTK